MAHKLRPADAADKIESLHCGYRRRQRPQADSFMRWLGGAHRGIDLVGDPIVGNEESEKGSQYPQSPAALAPCNVEGRLLHGNIDEVRGGVAQVRECRKHEKLYKMLKGECMPEVRPRQEHPRAREGNQGKVVPDSARLPVPNRLTKGFWRHAEDSSD